MKYANLLFIAGLFVMFCQIGAMEEKPDGRNPYIYDAGSSESEYEQADIYEKARANAIEKEKRRAQMEKQRVAIMRGEPTSYPTMSGEESTYIAPSRRRVGNENITEKSGLRRQLQREKKY